MTVDVAMPSAFTVDDLWQVPSTVARRAGRAALDAQRTLSAILERVEVPILLRDDGRLTFFPHDPTDLAATAPPSPRPAQSTPTCSASSAPPDPRSP